MKRFHHVNRGLCVETEECQELQKNNPDPTTRFLYIQRDDEIAEVSRVLLTEVRPLDEGFKLPIK